MERRTLVDNSIIVLPSKWIPSIFTSIINRNWLHFVMSGAIASRKNTPPRLKLFCKNNCHHAYCLIIHRTSTYETKVYKNVFNTYPYWKYGGVDELLDVSFRSIGHSRGLVQTPSLCEPRGYTINLSYNFWLQRTFGHWDSDWDYGYNFWLSKTDH